MTAGMFISFAVITAWIISNNSRNVISRDLRPGKNINWRKKNWDGI
jgi:hypothetical protein